jgi:hypothetical protein
LRRSRGYGGRVNPTGSILPANEHTGRNERHAKVLNCHSVIRKPSTTPPSYATNAKRAATDSAALFQYWSGRRVSNSRPQPWQGCALPTELLPLGVQIVWRRGSESNRPRRLCRPLHNRFATSPEETVTKINSGVTRCHPEFWSGRRVSNSRPQPWQGCALPTELLPHRSCYYLLRQPASGETGAGEESRTLDLNLGKVALYQLSYSRIGVRHHSSKL